MSIIDQHFGNERLLGHRDFAYIKPKKRRISEYEAVNLFVQPLQPGTDPPVAHRNLWPEESSQLRCSDWYAFRDPAELWSRTYVARQAEQERAIERATAAALGSGFLTQMSPEWAQAVLGDLYVTSAFFEHGLFRAFNYAQIHCPADVLSVACTFNGVDKQRHAEDILHYQCALLEAGSPIGSSNRRELWLEDARFQPMRKLAEHMLATLDWAETIVSTNLVIEALLGRFLFNEVIMQHAGTNGDVITPVLLIEAESDRQRNIAWTKALVELVLGDERRGDANREFLDTWVTNWSHEVFEVIDSLETVIERVGVDAGRARAKVEESWRVTLSECGLKSTDRELGDV